MLKLLLATVLVWASPMGLNDERLVEAHAHYSRGETALRSKDFVAAAVEYREAHDLFASVDRTKPDAQTHAFARQSLKLSAAAYGAVEEMPVEAYDTLLQLQSTYGSDFDAEEKKAVEDALAKLLTRIGSLHVRGVPTDAEIRIDGVLVAPSTLSGPIRLSAGQHAVEVRGERYKTFTANATVVPQETNVLDVAMRKSDVAARLRMETEIQLASVVIDDDPPARLPLEKTVPPGLHRFTVSAEGYREHEGTFEVAPGERAIVNVNMVRRRNPIGVRVEPQFRFSSPLRGDTPLNNGVEPDEDFDDGYGIAVGGRLQIFYDFLQSHALHIGIAFEYNQRPLNKIAMGPAFEWCPDALTWGDGKAGWCPVVAAFGLTTGGDVRNYQSGDGMARFGTKLERRFDVIFFTFGGGLGYEGYKRNALSALGVLTAYGIVGVGADL